MFARRLVSGVCASLVLIGAMLGPVAAARADGPAYSLTVVTDRTDALYSVGQKAVFKVALANGKEPMDVEVVYTIDKDGVGPARQGKIKLIKGAGAIDGTLKEPGFLRCRVIYVDKDKKSAWAMAAAGFDPHKIAPSLRAPEDFDAFWAAQKARLAKLSCQGQLTALKSPVDGVDCFDAKVPCVEPRPVSGYFCRPTGAGPKSLPAILSFHGAGVHGANLQASAAAARDFKALSFDVNAHGIDNGQPGEYYKKLNEGELKNYPHAGKDSRETSYFLGMYLRLVRAIEFVTAQPEWDGKTLIVRGTSQGGGQALAAAGLDPRVTMLVAGVPAMCDHSGRAVGRAAGWPQLVPLQGDKPEPKTLQAARYFDCQNFAARTKAQAYVSVGFADTVCPPTSVYAVFNLLSGPKKIHSEPLTGHVVMARFTDLSNAAIAEHIAAMRK